MTKSAKYLILSVVIIGVGIAFYIRYNLSKYKRQVVFQANAEVDKWIPYTELDSETAEIMKQYWCDGVGFCSFTTDQILDPTFQSNWAWSAAFISWVMKSAGADDFPTSERHAHYIRVTTDNRYNNEKANFKAYSTIEEKPRKSDIVCKRRGSSTATYGNVDEYDTLHCDIVTKVNSESIEVVGGNAQNKVARVELPLDDNGFLTTNDYFVIIKNTL